MKVAEFQGFGNATVAAANGGMKKARISPLLDAVSSGDVPLEILRHQLKLSKSEKLTSDIERKIRHTEKVLPLK